MEKFQWQGENVKVQFGYCDVQEVKEKPLWWYNYDVAIGEARIPAVKVIYSDHSFVISNRYGIGAEKLRRGGWPNFPHSSLDEDTFFETGISYKYNPNGINEWNKQAEKWFEAKYSETEEWKKMQSLKAMIGKNFKERMKG